MASDNPAVDWWEEGERRIVAAARHPIAAAVRRALEEAGVAEAWLVGGMLRDAFLGAHPTRLDVDVALAGPGEVPARGLAGTLGGSAFPLDEAQGAWRVALPGGGTVDLIPLRAPDLEGDLRGRDFTANALAYDLLGCRGLADPLGARADLTGAVLRLCAPQALTEDPVRVLRAYRFSLGLGLSFDQGLPTLLAEASPALAQAAPERVRTELFAVLALPNGARALRLMAQHGVLEAVFPAVEGWKGFDQGNYHAYDLLEHSLRAAEAAEDLVNRPEALELPRPEGLRDHLDEELEAGVPRLALLKLTSFLHDVAKPDTLTLDGARRRFLGHEVLGGHRLRKLLASLRVGKKARAAAQTVTAGHLRLFGLAHQERPTKAARLRYLRDLRREVPEAVLLSLADELATGPAPPALEAVSAAARELLRLYWEQLEKKEIEPLLRGRDVVDELGVPQGPIVGVILRRVAEAESRGEIGTRGDALALARSAAQDLGVRTGPREKGA